MNFKIKRRKYNVKGRLSWEYNPIRNLTKVNSENKTVLTDFDTSNLTLDVSHPVSIECQTSYDGSTNLLINDDQNPPRIINSAFTVKEDNTFERVSRNQKVPTNLYREQYLDSESRLQRTTSTSNGFLYADLKEVKEGGELPGGNYIFLFQYSDEDDNVTRIVAESGIVSIFGGHLAKPYTTYGTLLHEKTDKQIKIELKNADTAFRNVYVSYRRDFCDLNGVKQTEYKKIVKPYGIEDLSFSITIDGREQTVDTTYEELIEEHNIYHKVKTQAQNQNMLFFGNVEESYDDIKTLQTLALSIQVRPILGSSIGHVDQDVFEGNSAGSEYFNVHNVYDSLGYMPEEYYRIGIVFIYNDDSRSSVYNLRGTSFSHIGQWNCIPTDTPEYIDINELFLSSTTVENTKGVFKMPFVNIHSTKNINPLKLQFVMPESMRMALQKMNIKGYYYVRQSRVPVFLAQGFSIGVSNTAHIPMLSVAQSVSEEGAKTVTFATDSIFLRNDQTPTEYKKNGKAKKNTLGGKYINLRANRTTVSSGVDTNIKGLFCPDAIFNPQLQSIFSGSQFVLKEIGSYQSCNLLKISNPDITEEYDTTKKVNLIRTEFEDPKNTIEREIIYINGESPYISYKNSVFSTKSGSSMDIKSLRSILPEVNKSSFKLNSYCVRGLYSPFLGVLDANENSNSELEPNAVYNIYTKEYGNEINKMRSVITSRSYDYSEFTAICDCKTLDELDVECARGDCFTCSTNHKFAYNFLDTNAPLNELQVKGYIEKKNLGKNDTVPKAHQFFDNTIDQIDAAAWLEWNVSDANAVDFGHYVTTKYMSNFNNIRAINTQNLSEISLYGSPRGFLPLRSATSGIAFKIPDSSLVNYGLSTTKTVVRHYEAIQVPYINKNFDTRIAFSKVASSTQFSNGFRVFSNLQYQDLERTYGAIVKLIPYGANLFCVFEHGCGIVPINEKALMSTTTGQSISLYGSGVLQEQVTVISQDYGSTWKDSIVVTPNGIYGVDTWAKKIWCYNANGFELISDQIVQRFLNDNITLSELDWSPLIALKNVKTHFNKYKGDVMFTFYKNERCWNLCYNERLNKFVTKYSWTPLLSDNIQNSFVSVDRHNIEPYAHIAQNNIIERGLKLDGPNKEFTYKFDLSDVQYNIIGADDSDDSNDFAVNEHCCIFNKGFDLVGYEPCNAMVAHIQSISYATWDDVNKKEVIHTINCDSKHGFWLDPHEVTVRTQVDAIDELDDDDVIVEENEDGDRVVNVKTSSKYCTSMIGWGVEKTPVSEEEFVLRGLSDNEYYHEIPGEDTEDDELDYINYNNFKAKWSNYVACESNTELCIVTKLSEFVSWLRLDLKITPAYRKYNKKEEGVISKVEWDTTADPFTQTVYFVADYDYIKERMGNAPDSSDEKELYTKCKTICDNTLRVGMYTHGRAGLYDEINYFDLNPDNQIKPTLWYKRQEPFEFEFVVNTNAGLQKIFNNLVIISNNAEPESLEFSIVGDAYDFNKAGIFEASMQEPVIDPHTGILDIEKTEQKQMLVEYEHAVSGKKNNVKYSTLLTNATVSKDPILQQYYIHLSEDCKNVKNSDYGKLRGNIEYREDKWLLNITPIKFKNTELTKSDETISIRQSELKSAKLRDKWCKVRIKYKGDKLVVISAIQTMFTISFT